MQRYTIFFITVSALHVSGGFSVHHQELKNCAHSIGCMSIHRCGWFGGVAAATPPNQPQRCIVTDYFNNYDFSKLK